MITTNDSLDVHAHRNRPAARLRRFCERVLAGLRRRSAASRARPGTPFEGNEDITVPRTVVLPLEVDRDLADWVHDTTMRAAARRRRDAVGNHA